jgi:GDP-L-fucose synthase
VVAEVVGYDGEITWDNNYARNGTMRKWIESSRIRALGWKPTIDLETGLKSTYQDFLAGIPDKAVVSA